MRCGWVRNGTGTLLYIGGCSLRHGAAEPLTQMLPWQDGGWNNLALFAPESGEAVDTGLIRLQCIRLSQ